MLTRIRIQGFKCLDRCALDLRPLTLLAGPNAAGKSSVIQALLLLLSLRGQRHLPYLKEVVRPYDRLEEIACRFSNARSVDIGIDHDKGQLAGTWNESGGRLKKQDKAAWPDYEEHLFYLSAGRSGPEDISELHADLRIGQHGQFALGALEQRKDKPLHPALLQPSAHAKTLKAQLAWWLTYIVGAETEARTEKITPSSVKTTFHVAGLDNISPLNTGAGGTYLLKLLVMCLTAEPGDVLLMENPEIHLHPGSQSRIGSLLAFLAARDVQCLVETHCEHILHRVRYEIYSRQLAPAKAIVHYKPGIREPFATLHVNQGGHFCDSQGLETPFPSGFFDTTLAELLEMG
jgi:predicted ATPase